MKFLCWDYGLFVEHCNGLAKGGNEVIYYTPYNYHYKEYAIGKDYKKLQKTLYFDDHVKEADCIVNFDVRDQSRIELLRKLFPEKSIFGSGKAGRLEDDRILLKKLVKAAGLPSQDYEVVRGITALKEYLKKNKDKYVKINIFRGDMESFHSPDFDTVEFDILEIETALGAHKESFDFIVEDTIHADIEIGGDLFFNGDYLTPYLFGYELEKNLYIGKVVDELCPALTETMDAFYPILKELNYRGALSWEEKIVSQEEHYILDWCSRLASPFTAGYSE